MTTMSATVLQQLKGKVAVLYGGDSAERDVSLDSGAAVFGALQRCNVPAALIDTQDPNWLDGFRGQFAHAFIALHGRGGEDGTVQGLLQSLNVTYTGSGVMASALAMDKLRSKQLWRGIGLPTPEFELLTPGSDFADIIARFGSAMVKPAREGSSVGMAKVNSAAELQQAFISANQFDPLVIAERCISGGEFTVAVLGDKTLPAIRLETDHVFYDYDAKYVSNDTRYICPCGLSAEKDRELAELARAAFTSIGCEGWGRADVMQDGDGKFYLLEVNTVPGMTSHSLVPMAARAAGIDFDQLVVEILRLSLEIKR